MSQQTFTSSIYVKLGAQTILNADHTVQPVELDIDPESKMVIREKKHSKASKETDTPPEFIIKPRRQFVYEGQGAQFKASFEGSPSTFLTWSKDESVLHSSWKIKMYKNSREVYILEVLNVLPEDGGVYMCTIHNSAGTAKITAELEVHIPGTRSIPPKFINPLSDQVLTVGDKLVLQAKVTGYPRPSIKWFKNQEEIKSSRVLKTEFDGSIVRLVMENVEVSDTDSYKCIAENDVGIDQIKAKVTIQREIMKRTDGSGTDVSAPGYVTKVSTEKPLPSINQSPIARSSTSVGQPVTSTEHQGFQQNSSIKSEETGFQPSSVTRDDSREPPIFLRELHDIDVKEGDPVELSVEVKGTPPVEIVWVHNNSEVNEDHPNYRTTCSDNVHQLGISKSKVEDAGEFVCEAYNEYGEIDTFCRINVNENISSEKVTEENKLKTKPQIYQQRIKKISAEKTVNLIPNSLDRPPDFILKPHSVKVEEGKSAIFLCRPQGNPHPTVQWLKQGNLLENNDKIQVINGDDSILEVKDISAMDCGKYTCILMNSAGNISTDIELSISGTPQNITSSPTESLSPVRKRSTHQSPQKGGINRKIEMFEKTENSPKTLSKVPSISETSSTNITQKRLQNHNHQSRLEEKAEDFRDVLNRIKPSKEKSLESGSTSLHRQQEVSSTKTNFSTVVNKQQRNKSPVKVLDSVKKISECSKDSSDRNKQVNTISNKNVKIGKMSESPKHFTDCERSKFNVRKLANELTESSKSLNKFETENIESNTELTVKERQAVIHGDLKVIIDEKQSMILQEGHSERPKTGNAKSLQSPDSENRPRRNLLAEASQTNNLLEMGAVFGQTFEPSKNKSTPEKQKRTSVFERPVTESNEFQRLLQRKRNSLPVSEATPVRLQSSNILCEPTSIKKESNSSPIINKNVSHVSNINEMLDRLKDKPPKPDLKSKSFVSSDVMIKSDERQNRSRNMGEIKKLSRESSPNFRNVLNQIEVKSKNDTYNPNRVDVATKSSPKKSLENSKFSDKLKKSENSFQQDRSPLPQRTRVEFSLTRKPSASKFINSRKDSSEFSDSSDNTENSVIEKKLEKQRIERVQKWDELSRLYASPNETVPNSSDSEIKQNGQREASYQNIDINEGIDSSTSKNDTSLQKENNSGAETESEVFSTELNVENGLRNMNRSYIECNEAESVNVNLSPGHAVMMNLKKTKLSEVEELFEDFSRIDREFESMKRNPNYDTLETLDVDDADRKILSKISVLSANFTEDGTNLQADGSRSVTSKKQTKYSKKFDFEKSPASVEQLDFRHVLKRHVEPHHRQHPKFLLDLVDVKVSEGQSVTLECKVLGIPRPEVAWSMNNKRIKTEKRIQPSKFFRMTYEDNTAKLVIAGAYPEDDGEYVCSATNSLGTARCSCHLYVQECSNPSNEATDEEGPSDLSSNQPSSSSTHCNTSFNKISYLSTETSLANSIEQQHNIEPKHFEYGSMPSVSTSLDESNYDDNEFEDDFQNVKKEAPLIHEINPTNVITECGQKLQLQVSFTAEPKPVVHWFRDSFEIISSKFYTISTTEHFSRLIIDKIDRGDSGKYNVLIENEVGSDSVNTSVTVKDVPNPPGKPYTTETTLFTIILSWTAPDNDGGSSVKGYKIEMRNAEEESWETLSENCSTTSFCATNLAAHNPFFFRVSAKNKIGYSQPSPTSDVIVTKDNNPSHRLSVDSDDVFSTSCLDIESPISPFLPRAMQEEELPFSPRIVVPIIEKTFEEHYEQIEEVGKGKFGNVYKCFHKEDNLTWAAKVIKCRKKEEKINVKNEISIMNELTHPKLLMLRDAYETPRSMVLVMEYIGGGELFDRVADEDLELTERDCVHFMRQICEGVRYMHEKSIMHLDLKPENILCVRKDSNLIKIIDFGFARRYSAGESLKVMFGTPEFIAPEVVNYEQIGLPTDIWSLGVICYVLLSGLSPFMGDNDSETLSNVTQGDFDFDDEAFEEISHDARSFIEKCLHKNMRKRITVTQCIEHKWLAHTERNSSKKLRQSLRNLKQFMARRKWQKMGTAIRAIGRMSIWQKQRTDSKSHEHSSITSESDIASQSDLSILPSSRSASHGRTDSRGVDHETSDTTETDEDVFPNEDHQSVNNNAHYKTISNVSAPAEIIKDMVDCEAVKGDIVRFDIVVEGQPVPHVEWFYGQRIIHEDNRHSFSHGKHGNCSLIISDICESDEGEYTCKVVNDFGEDSRSAELIVYSVNAF